MRYIDAVVSVILVVLVGITFDWSFWQTFAVITLFSWCMSMLTERRVRL